MRILIPDAQFADDHALERVAAGPLEVDIARATSLAEVPQELLAAADAIVAYHRMRYDAVFSEAARACRILVRAGVGTDNVDLAAWRARGIPVCNVPDYATGELADHALALLLALSRGIEAYRGRLAANPSAWHPLPLPATVRRLAGARLAIVGYGRVGAAVARRAHAFGMEVGCFSPRAAARALEDAGVHRYATLHAALASADAVSLHAALRPDTARMLDAAAIAAMKPGALVVNTARGGLVDERALLEGLHDGRVAGAALDVLEREPPEADHPLLAAATGRDPALAGRVILTPHAAWASAPAMRDMRVRAVETARAFLLEGTLTHCVNLAPESEVR
jgi:lactate dehydrogenase-like 2-hydroxyacid dehydrogenase